MALAMIFSSCSDYKIVSNSSSPDGKFVATTYTLMGGGGAGWCYIRTSVNSPGDPFDLARERIDQTHVVFVVSCGAQVETKWEGARNLLITWRSLDKNFPAQVRESKSTDRDHQITIRSLEQKNGA